MYLLGNVIKATFLSQLLQVLHFLVSEDLTRIEDLKSQHVEL